MDRARERLILIFKGRAVACWILCAGVVALGSLAGHGAFWWLFGLAIIESTINQPYLYYSRLKKIDSVLLARANIIGDIIVFTLGLHFFGGFRAGILLSGYMLIMLYAFLAVRPREGVIATVLSIAAFTILYLLESHQLVHGYPPLVIDETTSPYVLIVITIILLLVPAHVGRNIYQTIVGQESRLMKSIERGLRIFNESRDAMLILNAEGKVEQANPKAAEFFNQPLKRLPGRSLTDILAPESTDDFAVIIQNVSGGAQVTGSNLKLELPDGNKRVVEVNAMPYARDSGPASIFIILRDVTERKRLEAELKLYSEELELRVEKRTAELEESKERYQSMFEKAAVPLAWLDPSGTLQSANKYFYALTGLSREIEGAWQLVELLANETDRENVRDYLVLHRKGYEAPTRLELAIRDKDGKLLRTEWFIRFEPLTDQLLVSIIDVTERRQAEDALRESEERYRNLVETSPDSIVLTDLEGKVVMANRQGLRLYGCEREEELLGLNSFEFIAPEDRKRAMENAMKVMQTGRIQNIEYTILRKDGTPYPGEISASLVRDAEGRPKYFIGVTRDISKRKRIENALKESEERYRSLFEHSRDVIYFSTREGTFIDINPAATELFGYSRDEMIGMDVRKIYADPLDRDRFKHEVELKGSVYDYEVKFQKKDGTLMDCLLSSTLRRDAAGKIIGYQGIIRDITEKKRAEQALKESEARYRRLVETSPDAIVVTKLGGIILMANKQALNIFGVEAEADVLGRNAYDFIKTEDHERVAELSKKITHAGGITNFEYSLIRKDGSSMPLEIGASLIRDANNNPIGMIGVIRDITERKRVENELAQHRERLEEQVRERTAELTAANQRLKREIAERIRAEAELRESEQKYRLLFESSPEVIAVVGLDGKILDFNVPSTLISVLPREQIIGKPFSEFGLIKEKDVPGYARVLARLAKGERVNPLELEYQSPAGENRWLEVFPSALKKGDQVYAIQVITRDITERKLAEERLRKSEEKFRLLAENASDVIWTTDMDLNFTYVSPSVERLRGYSVEEAIKQRVDEFLTPSSLEIAQKSLIEELAKEQSDADPSRARTQELELTHKNGSTIWTESRMTFLRDKEEKPIGILGVTSDITERKRAEAELQKYRENLEELVEQRTADLITANEKLRLEIAERSRAEDALRESERRYRSLFQDSRDAVYLVSTDGRVQDLNPAAVDMSGYTREELLSMNVRDIYEDPSQRERYEEMMQRDGAVRDFEVKLRHKDGSIRDMIVTATLWRGLDGNVLGFQGILRDITEQKKAEEALRRSEEHFRSLIENAQDVISILDANGTIVFESKAVERVMGYKPEEIVGKNAFDLVHPDDRSMLLEKLRTGLGNIGNTISLEFRTRHKDGSWRTMEAISQNLLHVPSIAGFVINSRDITERKEMEKARQRLQEQLLQAEHMAGVGQVAAGVAHDMNSPLTAISYYAQAMEKLEYLKKQDREKIRRIEESTDRIQNLLARIINYASAPPDKFVPVDLNILVRQVLDAISHELEMRPHAKIKTKLDEAMPLVRGSSTHLFDMVTNLVINALQALGTQKGQVTVSTRLAGPMVELEVKDTGAGIAAKDIERIFEPFFSRKKDGRGTGLGLAIVQRVVKLHGGEVKVKSQKGKGAVFTVLIPAALDKKT